MIAPRTLPGNVLARLGRYGVSRVFYCTCADPNVFQCLNRRRFAAAAHSPSLTRATYGGINPGASTATLVAPADANTYCFQPIATLPEPDSSPAAQSNELASDKAASGELASDELASDELASDELASDGLASATAQPVQLPGTAAAEGPPAPATLAHFLVIRLPLPRISPEAGPAQHPGGTEAAVQAALSVITSAASLAGTQLATLIATAAAQMGLAEEYIVARWHALSLAQPVEQTSSPSQSTAHSHPHQVAAQSASNCKYEPELRRLLIARARE